MSLSEEALVGLLEAGDEAGCVAFFRGSTEKERRQLASRAHRIFKKYDHYEFKETKPNSWSAAWESTEAQRKTARVAATATASLGELRKLDFSCFPEREILISLLEELRPSYLPKLAEALVADSVWRWPLAFSLVKRGLSERPEHDNYVLGLVSRNFTDHRIDETIGDKLLANPELIEREVWLLFEVEGAGEHSLAAHDKYSGEKNTWWFALCQLAEGGHLDRARLLEKSLDTLARDFAQFRGGWYARFHEALGPTIEERVALAPRYLSLLASTIGPTVAFALKAIKVLEKAKRLDDGALLDHIGPVLASRTKGTVKGGLQLLRRVAKRSPDLRPAVARSASEALYHEAADVQEAALEVIEAQSLGPDRAVADALSAAREGIAPSLRRRYGALLTTFGATFEAEDSRGAADPALLATHVPTSTVDPSRRISPIADLDELQERLAFVLENAAETEAFARVLDGLFRLGGAGHDELADRFGPVAKRARDLIKRGIHWEKPVQRVVAELALAWVEGRELAPDPDRKKNFWQHAFYDLLWDYARAIAGHIAHPERAGLPLLSAPTHRRAWVAPVALVERLRAWLDAGLGPLALDLVLALLRLSPDGRADALVAAAELPGEIGSAVRYALGADDVEIGESAPLWIAAARARSPLADDPAVEARHPEWGPDAGRAARYSYGVEIETTKYSTYHTLKVRLDPPLPSQKRLEERVPQLEPSVLAHVHGLEVETDSYPRTGDAAGMSVSLVRWAFTVWPACPDGLLAEGAEKLAGNLDWWGAYWDHVAYLEALLDSDAPLRQMGLLVLALGLAAKEPGQHAMAVDALLAALEDGRLDLETGPDRLGAEMGALITNGKIKAARWAKTLGQLPPISTAHARFVARLVQRALRGDPGAAPKDLLKLLELLQEALIESGEPFADPAAIVFVEGVTRGGKTAKVKKALLTLR